MQGEDYFIRLYPHSLQDTLKPLTVTSLSEISSEDIDLEYDLYDCDLDNAMAAPGSMFAPAYWADTTPTIELELGQLFPEQK